jgi:hypothetical protein
MSGAEIVVGARPIAVIEHYSPVKKLLKSAAGRSVSPADNILMFSRLSGDKP